MQYALMNNGNMAIRTINGRDLNTTPTSNEKLSIVTSSEDAKSFAIDKKQIDNNYNIEEQTKHEEQISEYLDKLEKYNEQLISEQEDFDISTLEMKPLYEGVLIKPYEENPFQRIEKQGAIITDLGGQKPVYKSHETGEYEEEEQFIHVGLVVDAGPTAKYVQEGDIVFWRRVSETPVPFFKQNLVLVAEHSIMTVVNQGLATRFNKINNYVQ